MATSDYEREAISQVSWVKNAMETEYKINPHFKMEIDKIVEFINNDPLYKKAIFPELINIFINQAEYWVEHGPLDLCDKDNVALCFGSFIYSYTLSELSTLHNYDFEGLFKATYITYLDRLNA